jgi:hypothetical protein
MSREVFGDEGDIGPEGYVTEDVAGECFVLGAQACREMMARFVEQGGNSVIAKSIRANWHPSWGADPGKLDGDIPISGFDR